MQGESQKLIIFKKSTPQGTNVGTVHAHVARLSGITFPDTVVCDVRVELKPPRGQENTGRGALAYDPQQKELIYVFPYRLEDEDHGHHKIWRVGQYLSWSTSEDTTLEIKSKLTEDPDILIQENRLSIAAPIRSTTKLMERQPLFPIFATRSPDGKWESAPIRTTDDVGKGMSLNFVSGPPNFKYTTLVGCHNHPMFGVDTHGDVAHLYTIVNSNLAEAASNDKIAWRHFRVKTEFVNNNGMTSFVTFNRESNRYKLYLFDLESTNGAMSMLKWGYIPLRKDGSIDSNQEEIVLLDKGYCDAPTMFGWAPKIIEWNNKIVVIVCGKKETLLYMADIAEDGSLPAGVHWKKIPLEPHLEGPWNFAGAAVVDDDFCD